MIVRMIGGRECFYPRLPNVLELSRLHLNASINMSEELTLSFIIVRENGRESESSIVFTDFKAIVQKSYFWCEVSFPES